MKIEIISENNKEIRVRVELPARLFARDSIECVYKRDVERFVRTSAQKSDIKEIVGPEKISNRNNAPVTQEYSVVLSIKEESPQNSQPKTLQKKPTKKQDSLASSKAEAPKPRTTRRRTKKT